MLVQTTAPSEEPISLSEARLHLKLTDDDSTVEDGLITLWIAAARRRAEQLCNRSLISQGWRLVLDEFPPCIQLERGPWTAINSLTYRDMAGATQMISWAAASNSIQRSTDGSLVADLSSGRIVPAFGCTWPIALPEIGAVAVNYSAGHGATGSDVPQTTRSWILLRLGALHVHREDVVDGQASPLPHVDSLLEPDTDLLA